MLRISPPLNRRGWSYGRRFHAQELRSGRRRDSYLPPTSLWNDEYFANSFLTGTGAESGQYGFKTWHNLNRMPQYNALWHWFSVARIDSLRVTQKHHYDHTPLMAYVKNQLPNRYGNTIFRHKSARQSLILDPTNIALYNHLPHFYRQEIEQVPSDEYLYSNQTLEMLNINRHKKYDVVPHQKTNIKSISPDFEYKNYVPERRPQHTGTWLKNSKMDNNPQQKDVLPIKYHFPAEAQVGLWGGVGILMGWKMARNEKLSRRYRKEKFPELSDKTFHPQLVNGGDPLSITVTNRTVHLIEEAGGFDHYILKTPVCELNSLFGCLLKRDMLITLNSSDKDFSAVTMAAQYNYDRTTRRKLIEKLRDQYQAYRRADYEIEWIGLPLPMALKKQYDIEVANGNSKYSGSTPLYELYGGHGDEA